MEYSQEMLEEPGIDESGYDNDEEYNLDNSDYDDPDMQDDYDEQEPDTDYESSNDEDEYAEEDTEEIADDGTEEWEIPEYIPESYYPPEEFDSPEDEVEWYKSAYKGLAEYMASEEMGKFYSDNYREQLISQQEDVEQLRAMDAFMKGNPELAMKVYAPQYLVRNGHEAKIEGDQASQIVRDELVKQFGKGYSRAYDPTEAANDPNSISAKMWDAQQRIQKQIEEHNRNVDYEHSRIQQQDEITKQQITKDYVRHFEPAGFTDDEYQEEIQNIRETVGNAGMDDLYRFAHFQDYIKEAYEQGLQEGRKGTAKNINRVARKYNPSNDKPMRNFSNEEVDHKLKFGTFGLE